MAPSWTTPKLYSGWSVKTEGAWNVVGNTKPEISGSVSSIANKNMTKTGEKGADKMQKGD